MQCHCKGVTRYLKFCTQHMIEPVVYSFSTSWLATVSKLVFFCHTELEFCTLQCGCVFNALYFAYFFDNISELKKGVSNNLIHEKIIHSADKNISINFCLATLDNKSNVKAKLALSIWKIWKPFQKVHYQLDLA